MENASKALIMAAGVLLTMLVIGLLIFAWGKFSEYGTEQDKLSEIDDVTEFNLQFTNYDRDDVKGYELISLANQVADYNFRFSNDAQAKNDEKYSPIAMYIDLNHQNDKLQYRNNTSGQVLFAQDTYEQSSTKNQIEQIITTALGIEKVYGNTDAATQIAKSIDSLILSDEQIEYNANYRDMTEEQSKKVALDKFNSLTDGVQYDDYDTMKVALMGTGNIMKYYEFYQFKRATFKCTDITYNATSGRVETIKFVFTGEIE